MASNRVFHSVLLAAGVLLIAACASQPASTPDSAAVPDAATSWANTPLLEKKFQRAVKHYQAYQYEGQIIYCKRGATRSLPPTECITEAGLRKQVDTFERDRNAIARGGPQYVATVPGGSGGG